jgi:hypothetical protein
MTGPEPARRPSAGLLSNGRPDPLPTRPLLTTPPRLQRGTFAELQRQRLAAQPWLGLGGLVLGTVVFFALALGTGRTETSLLVLGPLSTFALPAVAMVAFWWNDWPGSRLTTPWTGLIDTALVIIASVVFTVAGQSLVERSDLLAVFVASPGPGVPTTFPATLPLAGAAFTAMLQLTLACERWPLSGLGRLPSGVTALALSWAAGVGAYFLFVNLDAVPAGERAAAGLHNPGGPIPAPDFGAALIAVGVWQALFFIALRGWPVNIITRRSRRLLTGNALVIGLGALTYLGATQPGALATRRSQRRLRMRDQRSTGCGHALRMLARRQATRGARPCADAGPDRYCGSRAEPRPRCLRRWGVLDQSHAGQLDYHRCPQLHRYGHHHTRRHRLTLAVRPAGERDPADPRS